MNPSLEKVSSNIKKLEILFDVRFIGFETKKPRSKFDISAPNGKERGVSFVLSLRGDLRLSVV